MFMVLTAIISIGILIFIHEGGHFLVSRAFGVRVTEFMIGLPGPNIGFWRGGTKFGLTCVPLGGYARVCGMSSDPLSPHMEKCLTSLYRRGTATFEEVAADANIEVVEAEKCLEELVEWGSAIAPKKDDKYNTYRTPEVRFSKSDARKAAKKGLATPQAYEEGSARLVGDEHAFFESEYNSQYRSKAFWKRSTYINKTNYFLILKQFILEIFAKPRSIILKYWIYSEYTYDKLKYRCLFATHYYELTIMDI